MAGKVGKLTTHVLDTATGKPAEGLKIELFKQSGMSHRKIKTVVTNADGRVDGALLEGAAFKTGVYELVFYAGSIWCGVTAALPDPLFLDQIPIRFGIAEETHYHVPLLISPFGYSTYRGS